MDTRREVLRLLGRLEIEPSRELLKTLLCVLVSGLVAYVPDHTGLSAAGVHALFVLLLAAGLWLTEAIPAFAVALVVLALEIALLGNMGRAPEQVWSRYLEPWASPLIWLFLGGFVLGAAATKTGLDKWLAMTVLRWSGPSPRRSLLGVMAVTFVFSMFMSNTATAAMVLAVTAPIVQSLDEDEPFAHALLLAVPVAANLGGMGTLIGSPPNAIAAAALERSHSVDFAQWILLGLPPAALLLMIAWWFLLRRYRPRLEALDASALEQASSIAVPLAAWQRLLVMATFAVTVLLWMTGSWHGVPTPVVSFLPISVFAATRVIEAPDIRRLQWDVLLLIAGGLSLGLAVSETGLAAWLVDALPASKLGRFGLALGLAYLAVGLSNFMSNTAATNILAPIGVALGAGFESVVVVPLALGASAAMCLPISTPPNAIAFASGRLSSRQFVPVGLLMGVLAPLLAASWCYVLL